VDEYIKFKIDTKELGLEDSYINIYPLPCLHVGAAQSDVLFIKEHLKRIQDDPHARWVYMGDGGECVVKLSKGDIYGQLFNPQQQVDLLVELFTPIREKGLFGIRGNHGHRVYRETGLSFDKNFCATVGIPYMGIRAFCNLTVNRSTYDMYFHHGIDSGVTLQAKVNKAESFNRFILADAIFTSHSHVAIDLPPAVIQFCDNHAMKPQVMLRHQYICGSGYDSRTGYATEKGYPPLLPSFLSVKFDGRIVKGHTMKKQSSTIYRSDGKHSVSGDYGWREYIEG
jgi:hypothetical protein